MVNSSSEQCQGSKSRKPYYIVQLLPSQTVTTEIKSISIQSGRKAAPRNKTKIARRIL